jgi:hypothetical protein
MIPIKIMRNSHLIHLFSKVKNFINIKLPTWNDVYDFIFNYIFYITKKW